MEAQITAFTLGVLAVLLIIGIIRGYGTVNKIKVIRDDVNGALLELVDLESRIEKALDRLDVRIDGEIDRLDKAEDALYKYADVIAEDLEAKCNGLINENSNLAKTLFNTVEEFKQKLKSKLK